MIDKDEAATMYEQGWTLEQIGAHFGHTKQAAWYAIRGRVKMRTGDFDPTRAKAAAKERWRRGAT